jgi:hypothetical protein
VDRFFASIRTTFSLMGASWRVLQKDRELVLFPVLSVVSAVLVAVVFYGIGAAVGTFDRLGVEGSPAEQLAAATSLEGGASVEAIDIMLAIALFIAISFVVIFFNTALVAAAIERLRGGDPTITSGIRAASRRIPSILGWAVIAGTVGLILRVLEQRSDNMIAKIILRIIGGVWAALTFFVIPVLVAEGLDPISAIKRSSRLLGDSWGQQFVAGFGFSIIYIGVVLAALAVGFILNLAQPAIGIAAGLVVASIGLATVAALEGIFKAALYEYAVNKQAVGFEREVLAGAFQAKS